MTAHVKKEIKINFTVKFSFKYETNRLPQSLILSEALIRLT